MSNLAMKNVFDRTNPWSLRWTTMLRCRRRPFPQNCFRRHFRPMKCNKLLLGNRENRLRKKLEPPPSQFDDFAAEIEWLEPSQERPSSLASAFVLPMIGAIHRRPLLRKRQPHLPGHPKRELLPLRKAPSKENLAEEEGGNFWSENGGNLKLKKIFP